MARFRGTVQGTRGQAHRLGHTAIEVTCDGWHAGVRVEMYAHSDATDRCRIWFKDGSGDSSGVLVYDGPCNRDAAGALVVFDANGRLVKS